MAEDIVDHVHGTNLQKVAQDRVAQLVGDARELRAVLSEARLQIEYLHEKFGATGSGEGVLAKIERVLSDS